VTEARKNGMLSPEEVTHLTGIRNIPQRGAWMGNWLNREQARELLAVSTRLDTLRARNDNTVMRIQGRVPDDFIAQFIVLS